MQKRIKRYNNHYNPHCRQTTSVFLKDYAKNLSLTDCLDALQYLGFDAEIGVAALALLQKGGLL